MLGFFIGMSVLVAAQLFAHRTKRKGLEWVFKPAAALTFIAAGAYAGAFSSTYGIVLFVGLVFAAGGDVLLIPKDRRAFLGGLVSFLLGHVGYAVAFVIRGVDPVATVASLAGFVVVAAGVLKWLLPNVEKPMKVPVLAYVTVITSMVALSIGTFVAHGDPWIPIGAIAFFLSDLAVARDRFVKSGFINRAWGLPLYFFAQLILAFTAPG